MKRINNIQTKDHIAEAIRNEILAGHMKEGEELTQEALAETLEVSRMPIREALQTLVQEGFVERLPNRHMRVVALNHEQIKEIFCLIGAIEAQIVEILLEKKIDLKKVYDLIADIKNEKSEAKQIQQELAFHYLLTEFLDNKFLEQIHSKLMRGYISYAIKNLGDSTKKIDLLKEIKEVIEIRDVSNLKNTFLKYYMYYAEQFK